MQETTHDIVMLDHNCVLYYTEKKLSYVFLNVVGKMYFVSEIINVIPNRCGKTESSSA